MALETATAGAALLSIRGTAAVVIAAAPMPQPVSASLLRAALDSLAQGQPLAQALRSAAVAGAAACAPAGGEEGAIALADYVAGNMVVYGLPGAHVATDVKRK